MSSRIARPLTLALALAIATAGTIVLGACSGGGGGGGGSDSPTDPEPGTGPDRSGTWTLRVTASNPCMGSPASFTLSADLEQSGRTLHGTGCDDGNPATVSVVLSGAENTYFTGTVSVCQSQNANCLPPYVFASCVDISVQGNIAGTSVTGTYSAGSTCSAQGTFTGTIS
jgi:hypothetical protein